MGLGYFSWPFHVGEWLHSHSSEPLSIIPLEYQPWVCSLIAASLVGMAGIIPLLFIPDDKNLNDDNLNVLQLLLSFAVGGLLADVFLHLLPEAWTTAIEGGASPPQAFTDVGLCVLMGIFLFIIVEMMASHTKPKPIKDNNNSTKPCPGDNQIEVSGYLNLLANAIDNFAHGLAVAGSFLVSYKTGILTTVAILIHEIPHEIGDFAILLKSGFTRWDAAKAQIYTSGVGLLGAIVTLILGTTEFLDNIQVYVLGFTAGGFLNIALVTVLPELLQEERPTHSAAQMLTLLIGTATMASVALLC